METLLILYTGNTIDLHLCQEDLPHIEFPPVKGREYCSYPYKGQGVPDITNKCRRY